MQVKLLILKAVQGILCLLFIVNSPNSWAIHNPEESAGMDDVTINIWYGDHQNIGLNGKPQNWVNVLGNITNSKAVKLAHYRLNGGPKIPVKLGPDHRRLERPGDFNIDLDWGSLRSGGNKVALSVETLSDETISQTIKINLKETNSALPLRIKWTDTSSPQDLSHIVDGRWRATASGLRTEEPGYDRFVAVGDINWTNYEITTAITMNDLSHESGGVGLLTRWTGHSEKPFAGYQPKAGFLPLGCIGWYRQGRLELYGNDSVILSKTPAKLLVDQTYIFKMRVQSLADMKTRYQLKVWNTQDTEPPAWNLDAVQDSGPSHGSILLTAHEYDVTFGDVVITPISPK